MRTLKVLCKNNGQELLLPLGVSLSEIARLLADQLGFQPVAAKVNNKIESLHMELYHPKQVEFLDYTSAEGLRVYTSSLVFLISAAVEELYPKGSFSVAFTVDSGYFCRLDTGNGPGEDMQAVIDAVTERINRIVEADMVIEPVEEETPAVIEKFRQAGRDDVALLLQSYHKLYATYYKLGQHIEYQYGPLAWSTGCLRHFKLMPFEDGVLLDIPVPGQTLDLKKVMAQKVKRNTLYREALEWNKLMHASTVGEMNEFCLKGNNSGWLIKVAEALQEKKIAQLADTIAATGRRIVLIAGPSSSGKTTFSKRLGIQLDAIGKQPQTISLDDFFREREDTPLDENGEYDFEHFDTLDVPLFNQTLQRLLAGETVVMPRFNFAQGGKEFDPANTLSCSPDTILIIEGIHGLNPRLMPDIPADIQFKIFISPMTALSLDAHNRIASADNRLIRRIVRDAQYRGSQARSTIARWPSVRAGEGRWIFPFQENADVFFNSALIYELPVIKPYAEQMLMDVPQNCPEYAEAQRLRKILSYLLPLSDKEIPPTSLVREFVGGSSFRY